MCPELPVYIRGLKHSHKYYAGIFHKYSTTVTFVSPCPANHDWCKFQSGNGYSYSLTPSYPNIEPEPPLYIRQKRHRHKYTARSATCDIYGYVALTPFLSSCPLGHSKCLTTNYRGLYSCTVSKSSKLTAEFKHSVPINIRGKVRHLHNLPNSKIDFETVTFFTGELLSCAEGHGNCVCTGKNTKSVNSKVVIKDQDTDYAYG